MKISRIKLRNWLNFRDTEVSDLADVVYVIGKNASGKSNFLDALTFIRDIAKTRGGGLQQAVYKRGGMKKLRCFHAGKQTNIEIQIDVSDDQDTLMWTYTLSFQKERGNGENPYVLAESVTDYSEGNGKNLVFSRDHKGSKKITSDFYQTNLEQSSVSKEFQTLVDCLSGIKYLHLVPQLLKFNDEIGGKILDGDPFGQDFMQRISHANSKARQRGLKKIKNSLRKTIPHLDQLEFVKDEDTGKQHLEFKLLHRNPQGVKHREDKFSDGTLRLIAILWACYESSGYPIIIEEPELSLNSGILEKLHLVFKKSLERSKNGGQLFLSTHSRSLLSNPGINTRGFVVIEPAKGGSIARKANQLELKTIGYGFPASDAILGPIVEASNKNFGVY